jgi:two-component system, OmpR family, sensor kinase
MSRVPIRLRVTLAFALAMALVLTALGLFLSLELRSRLDESIDDTLRSRLGEVSGLIAGSRGAPREFALSSTGEDETFVQLLRADGSVAYSNGPVADRPVLDAADVERAESGQAFFDRDELAGVEGGARLLGAPLETPGRTFVVVVGASLEDRDEALDQLGTLLALGGPVALVLASLAGYLALGAALRPVEAMRRRAAEVSAGDPGERLPVPAAEDELRRLGETLNAMLGRLEAAIQRERRFVDDASHELRTPLALHKTELELALRHAESEGELRAAVASAIGEIDRLVQLAEDLLVIARSEHGELELRIAETPASELLDSVAARFASRAAEAGRALAVEPSDSLLVAADRLRVEQALGGIVDNALRHGEGGVTLSARRDGDRVELHVADDGPGFPPEFIGRAFERFSRADAARGRGGVGLGLAIVETIARAHGGTAHAVNRAEGGADVWIELPGGTP